MSSSERRHITMLQESLKLEQRVYEIFLDVGWKAKKNYRRGRNEFDVALFDVDEKLVGAVETKLTKYPQTISREMDRAAGIILKGEIQFYILFFEENAYLYTERGFIRLNDIPTPDNYRLLLESEAIGIGEIIRPPSRVIRTQQRDKRKIENTNSHVLNEMLEAVTKIYTLQEAMAKSQKEMQVKLDHISEQIERLSEKISDYQDLTERQLEVADSEEEIEKIISVFSEEVVSKIQRSFHSNYEEKEYRQEEQSIAGYFGDTWEKISDKSKKYLVSARLMFKKQSVLGDLVDYSGVCLLVTKALELEMARRFYIDYIAFLENRFGNRTIDLNNWPVALTKKRRNHTNNRREKIVLPEHSFTLGTVAYVLCYKFSNGIDENKKNTDLDTIIDFANNELFETPKSVDDAKTILHDIAKEVDFIREKYRNPSAHKNALVRESAKECIDYVIAVQRVMVKILCYIK